MYQRSVDIRHEEIKKKAEIYFHWSYPSLNVVTKKEVMLWLAAVKEVADLSKEELPSALKNKLKVEVDSWETNNG